MTPSRLSLVFRLSDYFQSPPPHRLPLLSDNPSSSTQKLRPVQRLSAAMRVLSLL